MPPPPPPLLVCRLATDAEPWAAPSRPSPSSKPGKPAPSKPAASPPAAPISIRTRTTSPLGRTRDKTWSADIMTPFQPDARPRAVTVRDPLIAAPHGQIIPVLPASASPSAPGIDLLFLLPDKRRLRLGASSPAPLPFDYNGRITVFADAPDGSLIGLDADRGFVVIAREGPARSILRVARVSDAARSRLTLARRLDAQGLAVLGYSATSGEVFAGPLDLGRAEIGPLRALASLASIAAAGSPLCAAVRPSHRFIADIPVLVRLTRKSGQELFETTLSAVALIAAAPDRLCIEGLELRIPPGRDTDLTAAFGPRGASAAIRAQSSTERLTCALEPPASAAVP